jgi:glycosyltransferase involved in cell wall biosynthesis
MTERIRVLRVIARLNIGGPAYHVSLLAGRLDPDRYDTLLVAGRLGPGEGSFEDLAGRYGARTTRLPAMTPAVDPVDDLRALVGLQRIVRRFRPDIVHTHTAKAGTLARAAALTAGVRRPLLVHTYHGHSLDGTLGRAATAGYRAIERGLAPFTDRLVGVSQATVDDLVALGVAKPERFAVVPLGLDLQRFLAVDPEPDPGARAALGAAEGDVVAVFSGRLVAVKRVDVLLRALARARAAGAPLRLAVVGDGELRPELERLAGDLGVAPHVAFAGYQHDIVPYLAGADIVVLSSAMEGTPVALIEAAAAARPTVGTRVGGTADIVTADTGRLVDAGDDESLGAVLAELAGDARLRRELGARGREHVRDRYAGERLLADVDRLYRELLSTRNGTAT